MSPGSQPEMTALLPRKMVSMVGSDTWAAPAMDVQLPSPHTWFLAKHHRKGRQIDRCQLQGDRAVWGANLDSKGESAAQCTS